MSAKYVVTAPLVQLRQEDGSYVHLYEGTPVPDTADTEHVDQLVNADMLGKAATPKSTDDGGSKEPTVQEILDGVGEDPEKAKTALAAEQESRGDRARKTLVEPLEAVIAKASS